VKRDNFKVQRPIKQPVDIRHPGSVARHERRTHESGVDILVTALDLVICFDFLNNTEQTNMLWVWLVRLHVYRKREGVPQRPRNGTSTDGESSKRTCFQCPMVVCEVMITLAIHNRNSI
jgi:predicted nucleotidyltransferase